MSKRFITLYNAPKTKKFISSILFIFHIFQKRSSFSNWLVMTNQVIFSVPKLLPIIFSLIATILHTENEKQMTAYIFNIILDQILLLLLSAKDACYSWLSSLDPSPVTDVCPSGSQAVRSDN